MEKPDLNQRECNLLKNISFDIYQLKHIKYDSGKNVYSHNYICLSKAFLKELPRAIVEGLFNVEACYFIEKNDGNYEKHYGNGWRIEKGQFDKMQHIVNYKLCDRFGDEAFFFWNRSIDWPLSGQLCDSIEEKCEELLPVVFYSCEVALNSNANSDNRLIELILNDNELDEFPEDIQRINNLIGLQLKNNFITSIPKWIVKFEKLQRLLLDNNQIGAIDEEIKFPETLEHLSISGNQLNVISKNMCKLLCLQVLNLSNNSLEKLPVDMSGLEILRFLDIHDNELKGLPESMESILSLMKIDANDNLNWDGSENVIYYLSSGASVHVLLSRKKISTGNNSKPKSWWPFGKKTSYPLLEQKED